MTGNHLVDASVVAQSLSELTSCWAPAPGVDPTTLDAARAALASSMLAVQPGVELRATPLVAASAVAAPALLTELLKITKQAQAAAAPTIIAVVRSPSGADPSNPAGVPGWARGGEVIDSYGPFQDPTGALHWVDLLPITVSTQVQFAGAAAPFAVVPVRSEIGILPILHPTPANELELGSGSVWFLASLLGTDFEAEAFTGFTITGGTLISTQPFTTVNDVYEVPAGATLMLTASLAPAAEVAPGTVVGPDAAAAAAMPPEQIEIEFTQASATLQTVADAHAQAYGSSVSLQWTGAAPAPSAELPEVLIPCTASSALFDFSHAASHVLAPSGSATIDAAAWALPLAATGIATLPEAAGPGVCELDLSDGAELTTELDSEPIAIDGWVLQIGTGTLFISADSVGAVTSTTLSLWPEAAPSTHPASIDFGTTTDSVLMFLASASSELLIVTGSLTAHLDRPLDASGTRVPFSSTGKLAFVMLLHTQSSTLGFAFGTQSDDGLPSLSLALENALLRVQSPSILAAVGQIDADQFLNCDVGLIFPLQWILPTLPDPYAASFDASLVEDESARGTDIGTLTVATKWDGTSAPVMSCALLTDNAGEQPTLSFTAAATTPAAEPDAKAVAAMAEVAAVAAPRLVDMALLDLSTKVDLMGVAIAPLIGEYAFNGSRRDTNTSTVGPLPGTTKTGQAPAFALEGMSLAFNGADVATFAVPQVSWEAMESSELPVGPIYGPGSDGYPLLLAAPDNQQLVPFAPQPVLTNNIDNVAAGTPFAALFSLPFGLTAAISQPNAAPSPGADESQFLAAGGTFASLTPGFQLTAAGQLAAAVSLTLTPAANSGIDGSDPCFPGQMILDAPYVTNVLGSSVETTFAGDFADGAAQQSVPLARVDLSGYGASIFSEWLNSLEPPPKIIKVQFETTRGRTLREVVQAQSVIYPYGISVVRTITMQRQNAGWVYRTDSGWQAHSSGQFQFPEHATGGTPPTQPYQGVVHAGALLGAFNVRNIREQGQQITSSGLTYQQVLFDADLAVAATLNVTAGAFTATPAGASGPLVLVPSQDIVGYVQLLPVGDPPSPAQLAALIQQHGPFTPAVSCTVEAGKFGLGSGTVLRCSAFEVAVVTTGQAGNNNPAIGVALHGAPQISRGGGWSTGVRHYQDQAPTALPNDFPVPIVQNNDNTSLWNIADVADLDSLQQPASYYSLMHATGTNKVLFEAPQIPVAAGPAPGSVPGLQFPKLPSALPGGIVNPGSPNLGDLASILNSTGLFPELTSALSLLQNELPQIDTIPDGFKYSKSYQFPDDGSGNPTSTTIVDLGIISINLAYGDTTQTPPTLANLDYTVDSAASPSWTLGLKTLSFQVTVPAFGDDPVLTITGGFYGDENTKPGLTGLNITFGSALSAIQNVFSDLQTLAAFLPGGIGANLDVAVSDGQLTVSDTFSIADLPLGLGQLTDVSLDLGLQVTLSPMSVGFLVGLGSQDNPFNWIATPLAGNGLMNFGVQQSLPAFVIQAGIGLGCAIDLGIASGSASITIAVELDVTTNSITLIATLTGQASVDVLDGLASASLTLSASLGFSVTPLPLPQIVGSTVEIPGVDITLLASCSVGIHISICWVVSISWDGSWSFSQKFHTPELTVTA